MFHSAMPVDAQTNAHMVTTFSQFDEGPSQRQSKSRSKACLHCRRRKMKCDGVKPACFQCVRSERADECEYDDGVTKTTTQMLYERLGQLEKRFRDLQATKDVGARRALSAGARASAGSGAGTGVCARPALSRSGSGRSTHSGISRGRANGVDTPWRVEGYSGQNQGQGQGFALTGYEGGAAMYSNSNSHNIGYQNWNVNGNASHNFGDASSRSSSRSSSASGHSMHSAASFTPSSSEVSYTDRTSPGMPQHLGFAQQGQGHPNAQYVFQHTPPQSGTLAHEDMGITSAAAMGFPYGDLPNIEIDLAQNLQISNMANDDSRDLATVVPQAGDTFTVPLPLNTEELPPAAVEHLVDLFVAHSQQAGVTMIPCYLVELAFLKAPGDCMANCIFLWGAHFSKDKTLHQLKGRFLQRALATLPQLVQDPLSIAHGVECPLMNKRRNIDLAICISTSLATYFFAHARPLEGAYHANTAAQLALCAGLHQAPDPRSFPPRHPDVAHLGDRNGGDGAGIFASHGGTDLMSPPKDLEDAHARQLKFWNIFVVERSWVAAGGLPAPSWRWSSVLVADNSGKNTKTIVTTPWPEDWGLLTQSETNSSDTTSLPLPHGTSRAPVDDLLSGMDTRPTNSLLQLRVKSATLYEAATCIASLRDPYAPGSCYDSSFMSLQGILSTFLETLYPLPVNDFRTPSFMKSTLFTTHSMAHAAVLLLNFPLSGKAYAAGVVDNPSAVITRGVTAGAPEGGVQAVFEGLLGYERVYSQHGFDNQGQNQNQSHAHTQRQNWYQNQGRLDPDVQRTLGACMGIACAAVDKCLVSAREIVHIINCIRPEDYEFLEPIVGSCWVVAARVLHRELERLDKTVQSMPETADLLSEIDILVKGLKCLGTVFPIGNAQARQVKFSLKNILKQHTRARQHR